MRLYDSSPLLSFSIILPLTILSRLIHLQFYCMIGYFLYKFSEVLLKAIIKANRENRKGIQSHTVFLQWVASSQNMPPCSRKECCLLRHQQLWQMWAGKNLFSRVYEETFYFLWRDISRGDWKNVVLKSSMCYFLFALKPNGFRVTL